MIYDVTQLLVDEFTYIKKCCMHAMESGQRANKLLKNQKIETVVTDAPVLDGRYQQGQLHLVTNSFLLPGALDPDLYTKIPESFYGMYAGAPVFQEQDPVMNYNCFINRMDPIRQSWLYQLIRRGIFDQGYVSYNMDASRDPYKRTAIEIFEQDFEQHLTIFQPEHEYLKTRVPYRNFAIEEPLNDIIMKSKFSLVIETYVEVNETITYSEKIFRCLKLPRPWVMFAMQGAVQYLRDMGYDVLDDIVDHSYDQISFSIDRQVAMLDQIEQLCHLEYTPALKQRLGQAAINNQELLARHQPNFCPDVSQTFDLAVAKLQ